MPHIKAKPKQTSKIKINDRITGNDLGDTVVLFGAFRCGNKPPVLPGEEKRAKLQ